MTYFVKVTRLDSSDYTIKNTVNAEIAHHINTIYVIMSYFACYDMQIKEKMYISLTVLLRCMEIMQVGEWRETHCPAVSARFNTRHPLIR